MRLSLVILAVHWGDNPTDSRTAVHQPIHMGEIAPTVSEYLAKLATGDDEHIRELLWPKFMKEKSDSQAKVPQVVPFQKPLDAFAQEMDKKNKIAAREPGMLPRLLQVC